jgi:serine/threonine-protein kinase RsbT
MVVTAVDAGPGIRDVEAALGGMSVSLGLGLPGARRLMDDFELRSDPETGTTVTMRKWRLRDQLARVREERRLRA